MPKYTRVRSQKSEDEEEDEIGRQLLKRAEDDCFHTHRDTEIQRSSRTVE